MMRIGRAIYNYRRLISMEGEMSDLARANLYCNDARSIITYAEEIVQNLSHAGACEGHNLTAAQYMVALKRLSQILERHRRQLAFDAAPYSVDPPAPVKRHRWFAISLRPRSKARPLEART
jgi:hypothetical protein